jgi:hypothetical protein
MFCLEYKIKETSYENTKNTFATWYKKFK